MLAEEGAVELLHLIGLEVLGGELQRQDSTGARTRVRHRDWNGKQLGIAAIIARILNDGQGEDFDLGGFEAGPV